MTQILLLTELMDENVAARAAGAYRIASEIRKHGYSCQVVDFITQFSEEEQFKLINKFVSKDTLMVGLSSTFFNYIDEKLNEFNLLNKNIKSTRTSFNKSLPTINYPYHPDRIKRLKTHIKSLSPNCKLVLGGAKSQFQIGIHIDAFITGYADRSIIKYLDFLNGKTTKLDAVQINKHQILINDKGFESFDFANSIIKWDDSDLIFPGETLPIEISRGCIFRCKFCSFPLNGKKSNDYIKSSTVLRDELLRNYEKWGITTYLYADDTHNDSIEKLETMAEIVSSLPFKLEYAAYLRHDLIHAHPKTIKLLRDGGLVSAIFGIESLNHESAKSIGKGLHPEKIKDLLKHLRQEWGDEVAMSSGFIVGLPHDTPETIEEWSSWVLSTDCPLDGFVFEGLFLSKPTYKRLWLSEFELNSSKFGYTLGDLGYWSNNVFDRNSAVALATKIQKHAVYGGRLKYSGFNLLMMRNNGISHKVMRNTPISKIPKSIRVELKNKRIQEYKNKILN